MSTTYDQVINDSKTMLFEVASKYLEELSKLKPYANLKLYTLANGYEIVSYTDNGYIYLIFQFLSGMIYYAVKTAVDDAEYGQIRYNDDIKLLAELI